MTKTILITGANRGIGLEFVRQYSALKWNVIACCRRPDQAKELNQMPFCTVHQLDMMKFEEMERLAYDLKDSPIDILINNAAIEGPSEHDFDLKNVEPWLNAFQVNTIAPYVLAKSLSKQIEKSFQKLIVNISSSYGSIELNKEKSDYF